LPGASRSDLFAALVLLFQIGRFVASSLLLFALISSAEENTLVGGYDKEDFKRQSWHEAALTDSQGYVHLSNEMANLPFLQVWVLKYPTCQQKPKAAMYSTDEIRRDGLSTPNRCGISTVANAHGVFIVFVNSKLTHDLLSLHPLKTQ